MLPGMVSSPPRLQGASKVGEMSSEVYWDTEWIGLLQGLAGEHPGLSGCSPHMTPHPPQRWAFPPPSSGTHSWSTYCLLRGRLPPSRPGAVPWRWRQPGNVGGDPRGVGCWTEASVWSCWGPFPGPRPMTGRLRMPPIIQLTEHKGATRGLGRPGARDGCTGVLVPHHRGQGCAQSGEGSSHTQE